MAKIIVGEKIRNKLEEVGEITSFDEKFIYVDYGNRSGKLPLNVFEMGIVRYESEELQGEIDSASEEIKAKEKERVDAILQASKKAAEDQKLIQAQMSASYLGVTVSAARIRLEPAPISIGPVRKKDRELLQEIFCECDKESEALFEAFKPKMRYGKYSRAVSKYAVGFLCKYLDTYVFRVFSRNDAYVREAWGAVSVKKSDTTEILRVVRINGKLYHFSKNLSGCNNSRSFKNWHVTKIGKGLILDRVELHCDCEYFNDYIYDEIVPCDQYVNLLFSALINNKVEIVFKARAYNSAYCIDNLASYLDGYTMKQIDYASQNNALNALPFIKKYGIYDSKLARRIDAILRKEGNRDSVYNILSDTLNRLNFGEIDLDKKVISFLKKLQYFNAPTYGDYINNLARVRNVTLNDFFDKDYLERHYVMMLEKTTYCSPKEKQAYVAAATELSWIDREENGYFIIVPKTINEFLYEGREQHNCVFVNRYFEKVINKKSIIVFLRRDKTIPFVTIEYDYESFYVCQALGKHNSQIDDELYDYIVLLGRRLKSEMLSQGLDFDAFD